MQLKFISIVSPSGHSSSLSTGGRQDKGRGFLCVVGGLPHNSEFKPRTAADRDALVKHLLSLKFEEEGEK